MPANELRLNDLRLPPGFAIGVWAAGLADARSMTLGPKGTLFVGTRVAGKIYAVIDRGDHREVKTIASGLNSPNGVAMRGGSLFVAEVSRILRYDNIEDRLDNPPAPAVVFDALPKDAAHGWKYLLLGPDGKLYFQIGAPGNIVNPPYTHAQIVRLNLGNNTIKTVALGVRNSVGMAFNPLTRDLWFTNNGRDMMGDDLPNDTLNKVAINARGAHFGYPYCHQGDLPDPEFGKGRSCGDYDKPELKLGPHVAPLGLRFYTGRMFPADYANNMFIAEHGSWNRSKKIGYRVVRVGLDKQGKVARHEVFLSGWLQGEEAWGRPVDVQVMPDGALLISDDQAGAIYRVSYKTPQ
ncbi:MAG: PQQ-dependent sugar dehydrogenase [Candidatus Protistobacter heckmanni]|nr:PQQ-dependent sugar dehydrogenase [Candidatus Protistobacter heckmanni]